MKLKRLLPLILLYSAIVILIIGSKQVAYGVKNGIETCVTLVIPSLFIFMVISNIIVSSKLFPLISLPFKWLGKVIFNLDSSLISIVLLSLVGGYPIGAKLIATKVKRGELNIKTAEKMLCYCVNCGPAFLISGVGIAIFNSMLIGIILYVSQVSACIFVGFLLRKGNDRSTKPLQTISQNLATLTVSSVSDAVKSMGIVCGLIVCFSALMPLIGMITPENILPYINGVFEVTSSCKAIASLQNALILTCAFTSFGGLCVHMQISAMLHKTGISLKKFFLYRIIYTAFSCAVIWGLMQLIPQPISCVSMGDIPSKTNSISPAATIFLILLSIILLFFSKKSVKIKDTI